MIHEQKYVDKLNELYGEGKYEFNYIAQGKDACLCLVSTQNRFELVRLHNQKAEIEVSIDARFNPEKIKTEFHRLALLAQNLYKNDYKRRIEKNEML
ncbi:hypothetical protein JR311_20055 (plasmid) [Bacillus velezensis]|uniref:hypothetical protein n=1 Tax=Bacillus velezensis TaxID=492670 RepID=UPI0004A06EAB|nr:hypothetical protein [Bacillus velezensis]KDN91336.1 hypothetical protein EF87_19340 [Bacillus amyloliquefaciens]QRV11499.1 hypothetical protein JR311_20055 [Bacillus velezensis]URJ76415.1 hypothetical protein MF619_003988 [Bacillus velezensis]URJ80371.1 hypothetical protein MF621_004122 [Bacillus velezensis]